MSGTLRLSDRPFIGDAIDYHRRDQQHDAAGWLPDDADFDACPRCGEAEWDNDGLCAGCGYAPLCPCGSGEPIDLDGHCLFCWPGWERAS